MHRTRAWIPWIAAAIVCVFAILAREFLIQPPEIAHRCESTTLTLVTPGPWWCSARAAIIMTYAWGGLFYAAIAFSLMALWIRRAWVGFVTLTVGLIAIVWYSYEPGAVAITVGALVLARAQSELPSKLRSRLRSRLRT